jgi:hypothetical protein
MILLFVKLNAQYLPQGMLYTNSSVLDERTIHLSRNIRNSYALLSEGRGEICNFRTGSASALAPRRILAEANYSIVSES